MERRRAIKRWRPAEESGGRGDSNHGGQEEGGHGITLGSAHDCDEEGVLGIE